MASVQDAFHAYAQGDEMDGRTFTKICKDSKWLVKGVTATDTDLIFSKVKPKGARKIGFPQFADAVNEVAARRGCSADELLASISAGPQLTASVKPGQNAGSGPERFFYDKSSYTGAHTKGGPSTAGTGFGGAKGYGDLKGLIDRGHTQDDALQRKKADAGRALLKNSLNEVGSGAAGSGAARAGVTVTKAAAAGGGGKALKGPERFFYDKKTFTGAHANGGPKTLDTVEVKDYKAPTQARAANPARGPERFFYDKSSYTGAHQAGGPTTKGSGTGTSGYADLSSLTNRGVMQNDALHRR